MFNSNTPSLSDIAAVTGNNNGWGNGDGWWILIILFAIFGGWGNGGFGNSRGGVADNYVLASDFATVQRQIDDTRSSLESKLDSVNNGICSLGYDQLGQMNGINTNIANAQYNLTAQLTNMAAANQACCCETNNLINTGFANLNYNLATQACDTRRAIIDNDNANYRALDARLTAMEMSAKDEKIAELTAQIQNLNLAASQQAQNNYIINQLRQVPVPAYNVPNPYTGQYGYGGCNACCGNA